MPIGFLFAMIDPQYQPYLLFCVGLLISVVCCLILLSVEGTIRRQKFDGIPSSPRTLAYRRFLSELNSTPRHIGFAGGEVYDLDDRDFPSKSK